MMRIDLNCDLGEGMGQDEALMQLVTSANVACGAHAGDEATMRRTVELANRYGVAIGAHPGFEDRENFGRRELALDAGAIEELVRVQVAKLAGMATLKHVKAHGALYNMAARDEAIAMAVARGVKAVDNGLILIGLAGSAMLRAGERLGLRVASEVFADRRYRRDGSLVPRKEEGAVIEDRRAAVVQVLEMVTRGEVTSIDGTKVQVLADTVCLHGDGAHAVAVAQSLRRAMEALGVEIRAL